MIDSWGEQHGQRREHGQGLAEYALILALIAVIALVALSFLGEQVSDILTYIGDSIAGAP